MKRFKTKLVMGLITIGIIGGGYFISQKDLLKNEKDSPSNIENNIDSVEDHPETSHMSSIEMKLEEANKAFEVDGMVNLYTDLRKKEKKKWLDVVNKKAKFESELPLRYQISGIYELGNQQYYILGWSEVEDENLVLTEKDIFELILIQEGDNYFVSEAIYPSETILSSEEVALYKKAEQEESNVSIEYNKVQKLNNLEDYVGYLEEAIQEIESEGINDNGKSEVTQYVQYAIEDLSSEELVAQENTIDITQEVLGQMKEAITLAKDKFNHLLSDKEISFNKSLNSILRLQSKQTNWKKPVYIQLPDSFENLGEITGVRILLDDASYVYIEGKDLEVLAGLKIKIERLKDKSTYEINFLNEQDEVIGQLDQTITFAFPAKDELSTVMATYETENQNWGGQYDSSSGTISFGTKYSGRYQVIDNYIKIKDIAHLTNSEQSAIKFMVSKGYLDLEDDYFYPEASFTRYEFAKALVKMFFALDTSLETSFKDISTDSEYYAYVASGETYEIIKGYVDQTFRGDVKIPREQVISLCARTIADKKGYIYPEQTSDYLQFVDSEEVAKWAAEDIALAVQSGLIKSGGTLLPKAEMTKAESAEVLYQLFMLLYETSPETIVDLTPVQKTYSILGVLLVLALILLCIRRFIKRNKVILTMIACTAAIIITLIIGFKGGF